MNKYLQENQFLIPSYSIYRENTQSYNYGIFGTKIKNNIVKLWKKYFDDNNTYQIETSIITPEIVLEKSKYIDNLVEYVVTDSKKRNYNAKTILKDHYKRINDQISLNQIDLWDENKMIQEIKQNKLLHNPKIHLVGQLYHIPMANNSSQFLRPDLTQNIVTDFGMYDQFLKHKTSYQIYQIGKVFMNRVIPSDLYNNHIKYDNSRDKNNYFHLYNQKEYTLIELLHFFDPTKTNSDIIITNLIDKTYQFIKATNINPELLKLEKLTKNDTPHYATNTTNINIQIDDKYITLVSISNRSDFDIKSHFKSLKSKRLLETPITKTQFIPKLNKPLIVNKYKNLYYKIEQHFNGMKQSQLKLIKNETFKNSQQMFLMLDSKVCILTSKMLEIEEREIKIKYEEYYPNIISLQMNVDKIFISTIQNNLKHDNKILTLPTYLSPYKIAIINQNNELYKKIVSNIKIKYFSHKSSSLEKSLKYFDKIGIKYTLIISKSTVLRDRDSKNEITIDTDSINTTLEKLLKY